MRARRAHHARSTHSTHLERLENDEAADDGVGRGDGGHDLARDLLDVPPRLARDVEDLRAQVRGGGHEVERLRVVLIELQPAALLGEVLGAFGVHGLDGAQEDLRAYSLQVCPCPCPCRGWTRWSKAARRTAAFSSRLQARHSTSAREAASGSVMSSSRSTMGLARSFHNESWA